MTLQSIGWNFGRIGLFLIAMEELEARGIKWLDRYRLMSCEFLIYQKIKNKKKKRKEDVPMNFS